MQSEFGWGLAGIVAEEGENAAWLRGHRYWYAGFQALMERWGAAPCQASIGFRDVNNTWKVLHDVDLANVRVHLANDSPSLSCF